MFAIIEIGSNNTKTHVYKRRQLQTAVFESNTTIEFKANYAAKGKILDADVEKLLSTIEKAAEYTDQIHIYGCSIFRNISAEELAVVNSRLEERFNTKITVVSQSDEAFLTAYGCYGDVDYKGNIAIFIGGGGSTEIIIVNNKKIIETKFLDFGVVDITTKYPSLKDDVPTCSLAEVRDYIKQQIGGLKNRCEVLILAGGDHLYWYNNAGFKLAKNTLYQSPSQKYMLTAKDSDKYDETAFKTSLDQIRQRSDNPKWFDGSRAMKATTNALSHLVQAKYIVLTKINMEDGLKEKIAS
jgi:exopolyphosphatase/pppGpp-phosphohydrolase